jgi:hypothetical protein
MPRPQARPPTHAAKRRPALLAHIAALAACLSCAILLVAAAAQAARNPRLERLAPNQSDQALAAAAILATSDLGDGWISVPDPPTSRNPPSCPGVNVHLSPFTLTGQAESLFHRNRDWILSRVQSYPTHRQALADFNTTTAAARRCNTYAIIHQLRAGSPAPTVKLLSHQSRPLAHLGQRALADRILIATTTNHHRSLLHIDAIDFIRGRYTATIVYLDNDHPPAHDSTLAHTIATRLHPQPPPA